MGDGMAGDGVLGKVNSNPEQRAGFKINAEKAPGIGVELQQDPRAASRGHRLGTQFDQITSLDQLVDLAAHRRAGIANRIGEVFSRYLV